jgi:RNA polymerase sigma-70 factor (ECF subfamily)
VAEDLDQWLPGIVVGDQEQFASWLTGAEPRVRGSLLSFASHIDVEAVLQEAFLRTWQVAPRVRPDGRPDALLRLSVRIARNLAISEVRRRRVRPSVLAELESTPDVPFEVAPPDPLLRRVIVMCREKLPPKPAQALTARLQSHLSGDHELAAMLGMKLNTFLQNFTRARKLLAECLAKNGVELR